MIILRKARTNGYSTTLIDFFFLSFLLCCLFFPLSPLKTSINPFFNVLLAAFVVGYFLTNLTAAVDAHAREVKKKKGVSRFGVYSFPLPPTYQELLLRSFDGALSKAHSYICDRLLPPPTPIQIGFYAFSYTHNSHLVTVGDDYE